MSVTINEAWENWGKVDDGKLSWGESTKKSKIWGASEIFGDATYSEPAKYWGAFELRHKEDIFYTYNPALFKWEASSALSIDTNLFSSSSSGSLSFSPSSTGVVSQSGVVDGQSDATTSSKTSAEKDYIETEFNTLVGEINLIPTKENMKIKTNTTINLVGVGKYLSGLYFVSEVRKTMSSDNGYSLTVTLYKNGFGDSLKSAIETNTIQSDRPMEIDITNNVVSNHIEVGDKVRVIGDSAVYSNAHEGVKIPDYIKEQILTVDALSEDGLRARLSPIWSWTYTKFLQLV